MDLKGSFFEIQLLLFIFDTAEVKLLIDAVQSLSLHGSQKKQLVELAKGRGLELLAVTDHDTIAGVGEARQAGAALGLTVIRGGRGDRSAPFCPGGGSGPIQTTKR